MLKNLSLLLLILVTTTAVLAQGEFAGTLKKLIRVSYTNSYAIPGLEGFEFREGSLVTALDDPEGITVNVYQKGTTVITFFSIMEDSVAKQFTILDLVEVRNIQPGWQIKTTFCRQFEIPNVEIVALVKPKVGEELIRTVKQAWLFNRGKRRLQSVDVKGIDCLNEG